MRKEISPELYNYNKYPGPTFHHRGNLVESEHLQFEILDNFKDAFDTTAFTQRFSEVLTKFDYIVGDWSNEQLRLRGFYKDSRAVDEDLKISRLEDYLLEYCSFGCAYFVLENPNPHRASFDKKSKPKKEKDGGSKNNRQNRERNQQGHDNQRKRSRNRNRKTRREDGHKQTEKRHFVIRQKEEN
ncbi:YutD family protein [Streptococcus massiliensis]|uniref:Transcriptional regulator n=1 Tax=Streptococcus massiliensis TaxID=313439 RepID=A0A380KZN9_9STRE|nr:YutD-like domain-containing protein [Streptococcus massiliensis]SUN77464.1 transcriptional regulator [Streptococcus massiliensis]